MLHRSAAATPRSSSFTPRLPAGADAAHSRALRPVRHANGRLDVAAFLDELARADADGTLDALAFWRAEGTLRRLRRAGHTGAELQHMTRALLSACRRHALLD